MSKKLIGASILGAVIAVAAVNNLDKSTVDVLVVNDPNFVTVNGKNISRKLLIEEVRFRGAITPGALKNPEVLNEILGEVVVTELMAQKAIENGLDKLPKIAMTIKKLLANEYRKSIVTPQLKQLVIAKEEVEELYNNKIERYSSPAMAKASIIFMQYPHGDIKNKPELLKEINKVKKQADKQADKTSGFGKLAEKFSDDMRTKFKGGVLNWISKGTKIQRLDKEVVTAIFEINAPGDISPVIETRRGLALVRLLEERKAKSKPLSVVGNAIRNQLLEQKKQEWLTSFYDDLKGEADIKNHSDIVDLLVKEQAEQLVNAKHVSSLSPPMFPVN